LTYNSGHTGTVKEDVPLSQISRKSKSKEETGSRLAKFSEKMAKVAQGVSYLDKNFFDFFDLAVKKFCGSRIDPRAGPGHPRHGRFGVEAEESCPAWMPFAGAAGPAGCRLQQFPGFCFAKPKAQKRHGCRFWAAQGIEAEIPEAPRPLSAREACG
jgi:hypothetical protein